MISDTTTSIRYVVTDGVLSYGIPFRIYAPADVAVFWSVDARADTELTLGTHYTVTILTEGGMVNLLPGVVPVGAVLAVVLNIPATQEADFSSTSTVNTEALETQLDRTVQMIQQLEGQVSRAVILPATSSETPRDVVQAVYAARDDAQDANSAAQDAMTAAGQSATAAAASAAGAADDADLARRWASEDEDAPVQGGEYSARHYAEKAKEAVPENLVSRVDAVEGKTQPATTTSRGIGRVATLADMEPGATVENGPAFLDAATVKITATPTADAVPQADADGKLDGWVSADAGKANINFDNIDSAAKLEIKKTALQKTKLSECTTSGAWTITGCRTDMPLEIIADIITTTSGGNNRTTFRVTSGADGGIGSGDGYFGLGRASGWYSSNIFVCYPTNSTVIISVSDITTVRLTAKQ